MAGLRTFSANSTGILSWSSLHEQVVHGDLALDIVGIASGLDVVGGNHR